MQCQDIADGHVIDRYLRGGLSVDEAARFEDHYMECPTCQQALDDAAVMARGFKQYAAEETAAAEAQRFGVAAPVAATPVAATPVAVTEPAEARPVNAPVSLEQRRRRWQPWVGSLAALLALSVGIRWLGPGEPPTGDQTHLAFLQVERSSDGAPPSHQVRRPVAGEGLILVLELDPPFYHLYDATFLRRGTVVGRFEALTLGERQTVSLRVSRELLLPGDYHLQLTARDEAERAVAVGQFSFRVADDG